MSEASRITDAGDVVRSVRITPRSALLIVAAVVGFLVLRNAFVSAHRVLGWAAASAAVAVLVEPLVNGLGRYIPRLAAVILTFLVVGAGLGALVFGAVRDLDHEVTRLRDVAPDATAALENRDDEIGRLMRDLDLSGRVDEFLRELDNRVGSGGGTLAENAPTAPVYFVSAILTIFFLLYGPGIVQGAVDRIDDDHRRRLVLTTLYDAATRARRTVGALLALGGTVGLLVWAEATWLDLPAPIVLGVVAGVAAMLPDVGILLGVLPAVALAGGLQTGKSAVVVLAVAFVLQMIEALWLNHKIGAWGVAVGPAVIWVVAVLGYTIYGPGGAVYGIVYAVFLVAVLDRVPAVRAALDASEVPAPEVSPGSRHP